MESPPNVYLNQLVDPDYADLIVENTELGNLPSSFPTVTQTTEINFRYSVINFPASELDKCCLGQLPYDVFPKIYTLQSAKALEETGVSQIQINPNFRLFGEGTLVGIIDTGIDYENPLFKSVDGRTRIASIWDQTIYDGASPPLTFRYGAEYSRDQINKALASDTPLSIVPSTDTNGHGTLIAGVAGGSQDTANTFSGVVPQTEFVIVKLKEAKKSTRGFFNVSDSALCYQESDIMFGIKYVVDIATKLRRPISICIAVGSSLGSHSGNDPLSIYISYLNSLTGVAITVAAGNEANSQRHFRGETKPDTPEQEFELNVSTKDKLFPMEIWQLSPQRLTIQVTSPTGERLPVIYPDITSCYRHNFIFEPTILYINNILTESATGQQLIILRFENAMNGVWRIKINSLDGVATTFNAWLPSGNIISNETYLLNSSPDFTITAPGNATEPLTVGAFDPVNNSIAITSGRGYTTTDIIKPELASPGVDIKGPTLNRTFSDFSGTGVAAAFAAGIMAMTLEWAVVENNLINSNGVELKELLIRGAKRDPGIQYPNNEWGYGAINIFGFFDKLRE